MGLTAGHTTVRIGLTGGIGSGKTTAAAILQQFGAQVLDADEVARSLGAPGGAAVPGVLAAFGSAMLTADGALDRAALRERVFADPAARHLLESLLHPLIAAALEAQAAASAASTLVFDVPLLAESRHWRARVDRILVIDCETSTQLERVCRRPGWSEATSRHAIAAQAPRAARRSIADAVVYNDGVSLEQLQAALQAVWRAWHNRPPNPVEQ